MFSFFLLSCSAEPPKREINVASNGSAAGAAVAGKTANVNTENLKKIIAIIRVGKNNELKRIGIFDSKYKYKRVGRDPAYAFINSVKYYRNKDGSKFLGMTKNGYLTLDGYFNENESKKIPDIAFYKNIIVEFIEKYPGVGANGWGCEFTLKEMKLASTKKNTSRFLLDKCASTNTVANDQLNFYTDAKVGIDEALMLRIAKESPQYMPKINSPTDNVYKVLIKKDIKYLARIKKPSKEVQLYAVNIDPSSVDFIKNPDVSVENNPKVIEYRRKQKAADIKKVLDLIEFVTH